MQALAHPFILVLLMAATLVVASNNARAFANRQKQPSAAPAVLAAFQGSCGSQGIFTQAALAQSNSIINVIESLKTSGACKPFATQLGTIQTTLNQIQSLQQTSEYAAYQADLQNVQLLTLAAQNATPGSPEAQAFATALQNAQVKLYQDQAAYDVNTQTSKRSLIVAQASALTTWGQQLSSGSSSSSLAQCLLQSPAAAVELGSNMAAFGGSFMPVVYGTGVSTFAQLLNSGIEIFRQGSYDKAIFDAQSVQMPDALECALESMSESYCTANDSYSLLDLARRNRLSNYASAPLWRGIDIMGRQLPSLLRWLERIQNQAPPQDSYQASRQNAVLTELLQLQQTNLNVTASINVAIAQARLAASPDAKLSILVNMIATQAQGLIAPAYSGTGNILNSAPTPFSTFQPNSLIWTCWLVRGPIPTSNCPAPLPEDFNPQGSPTTAQLTHYITTTLGVTTAQISSLESTLLTSWRALLPRVQVLVNANFARVLATNPGTILASARIASGGYPLSPMKVLENIAAFFKEMAPHATKNTQLAVVLPIELRRVQETLKQLTEPDAEVCPPLPPALPGDPPIPLTSEQCLEKRLIAIFNLFQLQNGTQVFLTDMNNLANIDLQYKLADGAVPDNLLRILEASGQDMSVALQTSGIGDLDPIANDLAGARADIEGNIQVFRRYFVKAFKEVVKRESAMASMERPEAGPNRPHGQRLGELCMLWLLTSNIPGSKDRSDRTWPNKATAELCEKTLYFNANDSPASSPRFVPAFDIGKMAKQLGDAPFAERVCLFHNYKIANRAKTLYVGGISTR